MGDAGRGQGVLPRKAVHHRDRVDLHLADPGKCDGLTSSERAELAALRRENRRLPEDVDILERATALFVEETR
ncbi:hypothetical protein [Streptomyces lunaelactis]|uniref:hypothetical protein n=1 Tax=Streptomyces lunaelactis TaxID=1535768 RepID=UPI001584F940|nr:hypothetical protein [Streptomyces lunaelactis]NUK02406.1 hypothetical protein [Streptomyces lunaelactis]NUK16414.1 hypothetical protein [Streptomyces lunaelactis]